MKKILLTLFSAFFVSALLFAQDAPWVDLSSEFLSIQADTCRPPRLVVKAVVNYEDHSNAWLRLEGASEKQFFGYRLLASAQSSELTYEGGEIFISGLLPDEFYEIVTIDNCGNEVVLGVISTFSANPFVTGIEVSGAMYDLIEAFQREEGGGSVSLYDYIRDAEGVSIYEKISFIQQFFYGGRKFALDKGMEFPPYVPVVASSDECACAFVFNISQNATSGELLPDGSILPNAKTNEDEYEGKLHLSGDGDSFWWWSSAVKGPAKSQSIASEGWHAGGINYGVLTTDINNAAARPYLVELSFNLLCIDEGGFFQLCDCERPLQIYYRYDTRVTAYGKKKAGGILDKNAWAMAQDLAVVSLRDGLSEPEVLMGSSAQAQASCDWDIDENLWLELGDVAESIATFFARGNTTQPFSFFQNSLETQLGQFETTTFADDGGCNVAAVVEATFANDIMELSLHSNRLLYLDMFSFSNLRCGGKRSWDSYAQVHSDFYVSGIIPGGYGAPGEPDYCCTQKIGTWVLASMGGPLNPDEIASSLGFYFGTQGPWNMPAGPGNITELTEWGWDAVVVDESCMVAVNPVANLPGEKEVLSIEGDPLNGITKEPAGGEAVYVVYDISGRLVARGTSPFKKADAVRKFMEQAGDLPAGLYVLQLSAGAKREVVKVFYAR